jgi:hypothetical protein
VPQKTLRAAAATSTLLLGLAAVWFVGLFASLEARLAELLVPESEMTLPAAPPVSREESDTAEVYSVVVREMFEGGVAGRRVVIASRPIAYRFPGVDEEMRRPRAGGETLRDFFRKSAADKKPFQPLPNLAASQVFLDQEDFWQIFRADPLGGWEVFYERYPNSRGYVGLSPVGFDDDGDEAFLYASRNCGFLCAEGWHVLLRKGPGGWSISEKESVWAS